MTKLCLFKIFELFTFVEKEQKGSDRKLGETRRSKGWVPRAYLQPINDEDNDETSSCVSTESEEEETKKTK